MVNKIIKVFKPLMNRVLVQRIRNEITKSGILVPVSISKGSNNYFKARVISVGNGETNKLTGERLQLSVKPGDIVIAPESAGVNIQQISEELGCNEPQDLLIYKEEELLGVFEE
ncbi:chaperonin GroS [Cryptosporidium felis]|nr:chaperonin GroS [Cryptosporidium felis]